MISLLHRIWSREAFPWKQVICTFGFESIESAECATTKAGTGKTKNLFRNRVIQQLPTVSLLKITVAFQGGSTHQLPAYRFCTYLWSVNFMTTVKFNGKIDTMMEYQGQLLWFGPHNITRIANPIAKFFPKFHEAKCGRSCIVLQLMLASNDLPKMLHPDDVFEVKKYYGALFNFLPVLSFQCQGTAISNTGLGC